MSGAGIQGIQQEMNHSIEAEDESFDAEDESWEPKEMAIGAEDWITGVEAKD